MRKELLVIIELILEYIILGRLGGIPVSFFWMEPNTLR